MPKIAIVGGGISGLVCAYELLELAKADGREIEIRLFEKQDRCGGTIKTEIRDGFVLEKGPDSFLSEKLAAVQLAKKLGIDSKLIGTREENRKSFIVRGKALLPVPPGFYLIAPTQAVEFMRSSLLSFSGRCRALAEMWLPRKKTGPDESVASFIRRRFGGEMLERVGQPMLAGIYTGDPDQLSLRATMPRFLQLEERHGSVIRGMLAELTAKRSAWRDASGPRYSLFMSFKNGMETLINALLVQIPGGMIRTDAHLSAIDYDGETERWAAELVNGEVYEADAICVAAPASTAGRLLFRSCPGLARKLNQIQYESVATINFAFDRNQIGHALDGFGFVVPAVEKRSLVACSFSSQKFENRAPDGKVLLRAFVGGAFGKSLLDLEDHHLTQRVLSDLKELLSIQSEPIFFDLNRYSNAMVQYRVGHLDLVREIESEAGEMPNLFLTGSSYRGVGIPDCIQDATKTAGAVYRACFP